MCTKIFAGQSSEYLFNKVIKYFDNINTNDATLIKFGNGEMNVMYKETIRGDDVFIIHSTATNSDDIMETFLLLDAAKRASAKSVTVIIPCYGYARQDRKDAPRVHISAKLMADLLTTAGADRVITFDLHSEQIQGFFSIPLDNLSASHLFIPYIKDNYNLDDVIIASPDVGGSKRASRYANALNVDLAIIHKERSKPGVVSSMKLIGDVTGKDVFMIDDMVDSGGTLAKASDLIMLSGAKSVRAMCTHPILSGNAQSNIEKSSLTELIVTDTLPIHIKCDKINILSVDYMISSAIERIIDGKSISKTLFGAS